MAILDLFRRTERRSVTTSGNSTLAVLGASWLRPTGQKFPVEAPDNVQACVAVASQHLAGLPVRIYRFDGPSRIESPEHPYNALVRRGHNSWQSWPEFVEWLAASTLLHGNGLAEIVTDPAGRVVELVPIPWGLVRVELVNPGKVICHVTVDYLTAPMGSQRRLLAREVVHPRCRTDDGVIGVSPLRRAAAAADSAVEIDTHAKALWRNADRPSGVLMHEKNLLEGAARRLKESFSARYGGANRGAPAVLEEELRFEAFPTLSPEDAEILAARRFTVEELARVYQVPPPLIGDLTHGTFTNTETLLRYFAQATLAFWARRLECELSRAVLTGVERERFEIDVDLSGLLRGDPESRWKAHKIALDAGVLSADKVREAEGWNPRGGEESAEPPALA